METAFADLDKQLQESLAQHKTYGYSNLRAQKTSDPYVVLVLCDFFADGKLWENLGFVYYYQDFPRTWEEKEFDDEDGYTFESLQQAWDNYCESVGTAALMDRYSA